MEGKGRRCQSRYFSSPFSARPRKIRYVKLCGTVRQRCCNHTGIHPEGHSWLPPALRVVQPGCHGLRDGGDAGRLCGFSTRGVAFRRFDTIFASSCFVRRAASEPPLLLLLRPHSLARPLTRSLSCDGSQVINGINPVVYYCWLACYYR